jgi:hypothetical protein
VPHIGATFAADVLRDLPLGANVFAALETIQPELIADRFNSGGLNAGELSRLGGFLASPSQNHYRIGDIDIASPFDGEPLLFPEIDYWRQVNITTGLVPAHINAPGLIVSLDPQRPAGRWTASIEGSLSRPGLVSAQPARVPSIARLRDWTHGTVLVSGPAIPTRLALVVGARWTRHSKYERARVTPLDGELASALAHAVFTARPGDEIRTLAWIQRVDRGLSPVFTSGQAGQFPVRRDRSVHVQSTFERHRSDALSWRLFGGYSQRRRSFDDEAAESARSRGGSVVVDRLLDGSVPALVQDGETLERRWAVGWRLTPRNHGITEQVKATSRHRFDAGADLDSGSGNTSHPFAGTIRELVDGQPARVWVYTNAGSGSRRRATTVFAFARDRIALSPRLALDMALRFDVAHGRAKGSALEITWRTWLPTASVHWDIGSRYDLTLVTGYSRSGNRLLLDLLAHGDPHAPIASVFRWDGASEPGPLVARVGPGTGGDTAFSTIDPTLKRPTTDEFVIALESRPRSTVQLGLTGIARRESHLVNVVNVGVPLTSYETFTVPDANVDLINAADDQDLPVFNRLPQSFGRDRYVLTNTPQDAATMGAIIVSARVSTDRLFLSIGATASAAVGSGGSRGFRAPENDQDIPGELFTTPNALTYARGRLFTDRAYVIKWTTVYRFPKQFRLGIIARYQDGQPFSRLVVVPGLNQGTDFVRAFDAGRSRFAFTGTLDVRLQKGVSLGGARLDLVADAYNLLNMRKEVEEDVVTGDRFRATTAVQPPRAFHLGLRATF